MLINILGFLILGFLSIVTILQVYKLIALGKTGLAFTATLLLALYAVPSLVPVVLPIAVLASIFAVIEACLKILEGLLQANGACFIAAACYIFIAFLVHRPIFG